MSKSNQNIESFLPLYDQVPYNWKEAQEFFVEQMRLIAESVNAREIGFYLQEELLSGKQFFGTSTTPQQYRDIFRKVVDFGGLSAGLNSINHGINVDQRFTLIHLWVSATKSTAPFRATSISDETDVYMDATKIYVMSANDYDRAFGFVEYILEI